MSEQEEKLEKVITTHQDSDHSPEASTNGASSGGDKVTLPEIPTKKAEEPIKVSKGNKVVECPTCNNTRPAYNTCRDSYHGDLDEDTISNPKVAPQYSYKFISFGPEENLSRITQVLEEEADWEVVSHSSTVHGMTLLLRRPNDAPKLATPPDANLKLPKAEDAKFYKGSAAILEHPDGLEEAIDWAVSYLWERAPHGDHRKKAAKAVLMKAKARSQSKYAIKVIAKARKVIELTSAMHPLYANNNQAEAVNDCRKIALGILDQAITEERKRLDAK